MFNQEGHYIWKFLGDASLSRSARNYMLTNAMPNRLREMGRLEQEIYLRRPRSVRVDSEFRLFVADYRSYRVQVYQKEAIQLDENTMAAPIRNPTLATTQLPRDTTPAISSSASRRFPSLDRVAGIGLLRPEANAMRPHPGRVVRATGSRRTLQLHLHPDAITWATRQVTNQSQDCW